MRGDLRVRQSEIAAELVGVGPCRTQCFKGHVRLRRWPKNNTRPPDPKRPSDYCVHEIRGWLLGEGFWEQDEERDWAVYVGSFVAAAVYLTVEGWYMASVESGRHWTDQGDPFEPNLRSDYRAGGPFESGEELRTWLEANCFYEPSAVHEAWERACRAYPRLQGA